jgi:hypothetical protein
MTGIMVENIIKVIYSYWHYFQNNFIHGFMYYKNEQVKSVCKSL